MNSTKRTPKMLQEDLMLTPELDAICVDAIKADRKLFKRLDAMFKKYDPEEIKFGAPPLGEIVAQLLDSGYTPKQSEIEHIDSIAKYLSLRAYMQSENMLH